MLRRSRGVVVMDTEQGTDNCHHEGRYTNWKDEECCSLCGAVLKVNIRPSQARNLIAGVSRSGFGRL